MKSYLDELLFYYFYSFMFLVQNIDVGVFKDYAIVIGDLLSFRFIQRGCFYSLISIQRSYCNQQK